MGRNGNGANPFRFILNHSIATACNVYLMLYPKGTFAEAALKKPAMLTTVWKYLNEINTDELLQHGRVYGGGLYKLEPNELRGLPVNKLVATLPRSVSMGFTSNHLPQQMVLDV